MDGNTGGDMHDVPGYPHHEERGRLGVDPRWWVMPPQGPSVQTPRGLRIGTVRPGGGVDGEMSGWKGEGSCKDRWPPRTKEAGVMEGGQKYAPGDGRVPRQDAPQDHGVFAWRFRMGWKKKVFFTFGLYERGRKKKQTGQSDRSARLSEPITQNLFSSPSLRDR